MRVASSGLAGFAVVVALALTGCGGSDGGGADGAGSATAERASTQEGAGGGASSARQGGVLRIGTIDPIASFNPYLALTIQSAVALNAVYPTLMQMSYTRGEGYRPSPDLAESWTVSRDGRRVTFKLRDDARWSDGEPITAADAAWTLNTTIKFADGPTGQQSSYVEGMRKATAVDPTTLVIDYPKAQPNTLMLLASGFSMLPRHVWAEQAAGDGRGLRTFQPDKAPGGLVGGGPYLLKEYDKKGTTAYVRNPDYYGAASNADAVAVTYYTGADAMVQDFRSGQLDFMERVPTTAVSAVEDTDGATIVAAASEMQADLFFNSNPRKPRNRELLEPAVRTALAMCVDRAQIRDVVFAGYANEVETLVGTLAGDDYNASLRRPYDCDRANAELDRLGFRRGSDGIRVVPATSGAHAQPAHPMDYEVATESSGSQSYNQDRTVAILRENLARIGVRVRQRVIGDETTTWTYISGEDCDGATSRGYEQFDMSAFTSYAEIDALDTLSGELKQTWCAWNFSGSDNPRYDALYERASRETDDARRRQMVLELQRIYFDTGALLALAEGTNITAHSSRWTGFAPAELSGSSPRFYTDPHLAG